ncbi:transcriptional regulator, LacI family [Hydrocarboniphaga daqingensis]|jgi:DNA-binding LacI/PurR family transcriptional regulator|uniref:Transcriptional regulator, LacI family n=1 Tax=Hydrocarboniphaga daqingensis TaxID=490188 RepID=A0A1M5LQ70_9GAMM|nr:LacI family DNA-binding transcriptional regulator [Hydrocarboniphaga daqingensis]SHG67302.1 transcriptional regulator, LacI family [Hydrocarboniphaga daqingensis]
MKKTTTGKAGSRAKPVDTRSLQMADIARMAGVSVSTVSRALSGSALISEKTRTRVEDLARTLNYAVNIGAQNLRLKQNRTIAVVVPYDRSTRQHVSEPFFLSMLGSLADAITDRGYDMLLSRVDADELHAVSKLVRSGRANGIIMIGQWRHHDQLNELAANDFPIVVWGAQLPRQLYCSVGSDNLEGGRLATRHLIASGRKRLVFFGDVDFPEAAMRFEGFKRAHADAGLRVRSELCIKVDFTAESAREATQRLLLSGHSFDGLFACSDLMAVTAINTLAENGHVVPDEVAVVGYDDIELSRHFRPGLTTIRQPLEQAGIALVDSLLAVLDGRQPLPTVLEPVLVERATCVVGAKPPTVAQRGAPGA